MPGYVKLFSKILDSTIWTEDSDTKVIWITLLAMADRDGMVECTIPGLAGRAKVSIEKTEQALERFQQPDKYSWSQSHEGRRISRTDRGWLLLNYEHYREMLDADEVREKARLRQERSRERKKGRIGHALSRDVTPVTQSNYIASAPAKAITPTPVSVSASPFDLQSQSQALASHVMQECQLAGRDYREIVQEILRTTKGDMAENGQRMIDAVNKFKPLDIKFKMSVKNFLTSGTWNLPEDRWGKSTKKAKHVDLAAMIREEDRRNLEERLARGETI